eukprot:Tbor_TRINITY_DN542_c0_g1::TRINITY_DN542_c0_g1_i1::g.23355::m.23355/K13280/SEC11, sipW; signal peptidase, endoplasmic reticulum-type
MMMFREELKTIKGMNKRDFIHQCVSICQVLAGALIMWKIGMYICCSESPIVVVLSGSMEPAYYRGDVLFLNMWSDDIIAGDVIVFRVEGRDIPIVHRVLQVHATKPHDTDTGVEVFLLTKGDHNNDVDIPLYAPGQRWVRPSHVMGRARSFLPYCGMLTIVMTEYKWVQVIISVVLLFVLFTNKENK